jgi:hypothetical protein
MGSVRLSVVDQGRIASGNAFTEVSSESFVAQTLASVGGRIDEWRSSSVAQGRRIRSTRDVRHFTMISDVGEADFLVAMTRPDVKVGVTGPVTTAFDRPVGRTFRPHVGSVRETSKGDKLGMTAITRRFEVEVVDSVIGISRTGCRRFLSNLALCRILVADLITNVFSDSGATLGIVQLVDITGIAGVPNTIGSKEILILFRDHPRTRTVEIQIFVRVVRGLIFVCRKTVSSTTAHRLRRRITDSGIAKETTVLMNGAVLRRVIDRRRQLTIGVGRESSHVSSIAPMADHRCVELCRQLRRRSRIVGTLIGSVKRRPTAFDSRNTTSEGTIVGLDVVSDIRSVSDLSIVQGLGRREVVPKDVEIETVGTRIGRGPVKEMDDFPDSWFRKIRGGGPPDLRSIVRGEQTIEVVLIRPTCSLDRVVHDSITIDIGMTGVVRLVDVQCRSIGVVDIVGCIESDRGRSRHATVAGLSNDSSDQEKKQDDRTMIHDR